MLRNHSISNFFICSNKTFVDKQGYAQWFVLDKFKNLSESRNCHEQHKRLSRKSTLMQITRAGAENLFH
jgi:hypothetical protein